MISPMLLVIVIVLGLITGSFLNAVIYRLPRGISLMHPKRSFCPNCGKSIPWHENLPVISWLLLRGRCSGCDMPIALRYPLVELLTAGLYLLAWERFGLPLAPAFWLFLSLLVVATFIDIDYLIIPDEITLGGAAAGLLCATLVPPLMGETIWWKGFLFSALGAAFGYFLLWGVVELGKLAFGHYKIRCKTPQIMELVGRDEDVFLDLGEETMALSDFYTRDQDKVEAACLWLEILGERFGPGKLFIENERVIFLEKGSFQYHQSREWHFSVLPDDVALTAEVTEVRLPREAMGFGDVKFLACIGAFIGWKGVLFSLFAGSIIGAIVGVTTLLLTRGRSGGKIPFGPYLALGSLLWLIRGPELLNLYFAQLPKTAFFLSLLHLSV